MSTPTIIAMSDDLDRGLACASCGADWLPDPQWPGQRYLLHDADCAVIAYRGHVVDGSWVPYSPIVKWQEWVWWHDSHGLHWEDEADLLAELDEPEPLPPIDPDDPFITPPWHEV